MSIQTSVYVDGHWTTRTMDIDQIIAQNRDEGRQKKPISALSIPQKPPSLAILTQTIIRSPVVKWIIPAQIRHENKNDVVFVSDEYIEIKEIIHDGDGYMQNMAVKADFDSSIRSARVVGLPRRYYFDDCRIEGSDAIVKKEPQDMQIPPHILVLTLESNKLVFLFALDESPSQISFVSYQRPLPSHGSSLEALGEHVAVDPRSRAMAIAAFEGSLVLYALTSMDEMRRDVEAAGGIRSENFMPVREERHIMVDGLILKMEFLHPPESDQSKNHVILLLVVSKNKQSKLVCYEWDCSTSLETATWKGPGQVLQPDQQLPLLLVPLKKSTAFMLVSEKCLTVYRDILTGPAKAHVLRVTNQEPPQEPGSSKRLPIWTQWARPMRNKAHTQIEDNIYLCREDGVVHFLEIKDRAGMMLDATHGAGFLGVNINTSFAAIDMGFKTEIEDESADVNSVDMLIGGGDMCDGGRWSFGAREVAHKIDIIPNWTPLMDLTATEGVKNIGGNLGRAGQVSALVQGQTRFFASSGRGSKHGRITEIRYGIEAVRKIHLSELQELALITITQVWVLNEADGGFLVLLSYPTRTSLWIGGSDEALDPIDGTDYEIHYDQKTIAAGMSADNLIVQVTEKSVRASKSQMEAFDLQANILAACVRRSENDDAQMHLLVAVKNEDGVYLRLGCFDTAGHQIDYSPIGRPVKLTSEPASVSLEFIGDDYFAMVGTQESTLQMYRVNPRASMVLAFEYVFGGEFAVCDSLAVLTMQSRSDIEHLLVCGLRNGAVETLRVNLSSSVSRFINVLFRFFTLLVRGKKTSASIISGLTRQSIFSSALEIVTPTIDNCIYQYSINSTELFTYEQLSHTSLTSEADDDLLSFCERLQIGNTTVTVATDHTRISRAIILCEDKLRCLEYPIDALAKPQLPTSLNKIWLTDNGLPGFQQRKIIAVTQASSGFAEGLLFCVERSQIHMARIAGSSEPRMVPRHIHVKGTPIRVLYSQRLKKLIVLFYHISITHAIQRNKNRIPPNQRSLKYKITIVDPDVESNDLDLDQDNDMNIKSAFDGEPGERFLGVSEWFPNDGKDVHHLFVVHTMLERPTASESKGRILFLSMSEDGNLMLRRQYLEDFPVYALASYGPNSLLYSCGMNVCLRTLDMRAGESSVRMQQPIKRGLGTRGLHISTDEPLVYVTTDQNGLMVFKVEENKLVPHLNDVRAREGLHHLTIPEFSLTITSQKNCTIAGLWEPPKRSVENSASIVFEATLPGSVTRFRQIHRPPWQKSSLGLEKASAASISDPIIGTSTNGAIYQFEILDEPSRSLLRFIQNMALRDRLICPFGDAFSFRQRHLDPTLPREENLHVDGDIIRRLLDRGAERTLRTMLERIPATSSSSSSSSTRGGIEFDFGSSAARQKRFAELARDAGIVGWGNGQELMTAVIRWIRIRLQIAL